MTRTEAIRMIDAAGKRNEFVAGWDGRAPEEYFDEYSYKEPEIWFDVLNDLEIPFES